ncbi:MAG: DUF1194 domain-containing protein [Pseudomonadota bacterium]
MSVRSNAIGLAAGVLAASAVSAAAFECHTALVLGLDASRSVDAGEHRLQREGLAAALMDPIIMDAIAPYEGLGVVAMAFEWSNPGDQVVIAPWTVLDGPAAIEAFAGSILSGPSIERRWRTGIGAAMRFAADQVKKAPADCRRRVVDISGDGPGNAGTPPEVHRRAGVLDGLTINGLVIRHPEFDSAQPPDKDPLRYFTEHVVQGPGAFIEVTSSYQDYPEAILRKLLRELSPAVAQR